MIEVFRCVIPGQPVPQARARISPQGHHIMAPKSRAWRKLAVGHLVVRASQTGLGKLDCLMAMRLVVVQARPKNRPDRVFKEVWDTGTRCSAGSAGDVDNFVKAAKDAMTDAGVWTDDHLVARYKEPFGKWYAAVGEQPHVEVVVYRLEASDG